MHFLETKRDVLRSFYQIGLPSSERGKRIWKFNMLSAPGTSLISIKSPYHIRHPVTPSPITGVAKAVQEQLWDYCA